MKNQSLREGLREALKSNSTPKEIYDTIVDTLRHEIKCYETDVKRAENLLLLVKGNLSALYGEINGDWCDSGYGENESFSETLKREGYEYTPLPHTLDAYNAQNVPEVWRKY